ncbi:MAG TPA: VOC family protein [Anaerolineae bacterium]|nr:VOC family protein [Anaerolineae bacterium]
MSQFKNVNVVSIQVADWEQAKRFYAEVLDWPVAAGIDEVGWWEFGREGETHVALSRWEGPNPLPAHEGTTKLVLTVDDCHEVTRQLRARGIPCDDVVTIPGMVVFGGFTDPEGNHIQIANAEAPAP